MGKPSRGCGLEAETCKVKKDQARQGSAGVVPRSECVNTDCSPVLLCGPFCLLAPGFTASWFPCLRQASEVRRRPRALGLVSTCQTPDTGASDPRSTLNLSGKVSDILGIASPGVTQSWQRPNINSVMASWSKECSGKYLVLLFIRTLGFKLIAKHVRLPFRLFFLTPKRQNGGKVYMSTGQ